MWDNNGMALAENMVTGEKYRFTVLTSRLIRMEYDENGVFENRATQTVIYRNFDKNHFSCVIENGEVTIETDHLVLKHLENCDFSAETLSIKLKNSPNSVWHYGDKIKTLDGTVSTLDGVDGSTKLESSLCSKDGYAVVDDSDKVVFTDEGWFANREKGQIDIYFFGYGHDYLDCIKDFYRLTGAPSLLPAYALGNWWSRYHKYTQKEYCDLIERFEKENIPFSVAIVDMDWHIVNIPEEHRIGGREFTDGWTGFTWNEEFFPDYKAFLKFFRDHDLKTALNLHPAQGVGSHEAMYKEMAEACGIDPATKERVKLDILNPDFMEKYFDILHHPYEEDGVDFWWMDWQQGTNYWWIHDEKHEKNELETINPLWLLNHLHIIDINRNGKRPMFFSRYCGLGSHRYSIGFSGDTVTSWNSLEFQPYFTSTAANAGYGRWSNDIGGHMQGYRNDELVVRWMQLGVFSPINRLHSTDSPFTGKEPWNLNPTASAIASNWLRLRHRLFPYLYTMNYRNHKDLVPMILPMYYSHPEETEAYAQKNQYWFGSELIVSPITEKCDEQSLRGKANVWFPEGKWFDVFNGLVYEGGRTTTVYRTLEQMPVFAREGAIVPTENFTGDNKIGNKEDISLYVFPGASNTFSMYEDSGDYNNYNDGEYCTTEMSLNWGDKALFTIAAANGDTSLIPQKRNWTVNFRGFTKDMTVKVLIDGSNVTCPVEYDDATNTAIVKLENISIASNISIELASEKDLVCRNENVLSIIFEMLMHAQTSYPVKESMWDLVNKNRTRMYWVCTDEINRGLLGAITELIELRKYD